jgi:hypothetical protein
MGTEVRICAHGVGIYTTEEKSGTKYWLHDGTSMSAPMVAGVAALVKSKFPLYSAAQIRTQIELSVDDLGDPGRDTLFGFGRVNAYNSVKNLYVPQMYPTIANALNYATAGQTIVVTEYLPTDCQTHIRIPSGVTLELKPGARVNFRYGLTVYGNIITNGAALDFSGYSYDVSMTCYGKVECHNTKFSSAGWRGISLYGNGTNNSIFDSCIIVNVFTGSALAFYGSSNSTVSYCTISGMMGRGLNAIYASGSNLNIYKNKIQNNNSAGVLASSNSNITFGPITAICNSGNNTITGNGTGISATYSSYISLYEINESTHNNISGNTNANASAFNYSVIESRENYWGTNPSDGIQHDTTSRILLGPNLTCIPTLPFNSISMFEENNSIIIEPSLKKVAYSDVSSDIKEELRRARGLSYSEKYNEAMNIYKSILSTTKDSQYISESLNGILFIYRITEDKEVSKYLKDYARNEANPFTNIAYANVLIVDGYIDDALLEYDEIVKNNTNTCHAIQALMLQAYIYYFDKNDINKANEKLTEVEKIAKEDGDVKQLRAVVTRDVYEEGKEFTDNNELEKTEVEVADY